MSAHQTSPCRSPKCGKPVIWAAITKADGTPGKIPLDPKPPCYEIVGTGGMPTDGAMARRAPNAFVSHYATCADASAFSKSAGPSVQDEAASLREQLQKARDEIVVLKERLKRRETLFDMPGDPA